MQTFSATFSREYRVCDAKTYKQVFASSRRFNSGIVTVLVRPNGLPRARLGLVVSKKCARRAVARNRIKRLIRESFRQDQKRLCGLDLVVISRHEITKKTNKEVFCDFANLWERIQPCAAPPSI